jgi:hypothetical protein
MIALVLLFAVSPLAQYRGDSVKPFLALEPGGHTAQVARVLFTPDGRNLLTVSLDKTIREWDIKTGRTERIIRPPIADGYEGSLYTGALSANGQLLAVAGYNKPGRSKARIQIFALDENRLARTLAGHDHDIVSLTFSPDGRWLASGSRDQTAIVWNVASGSAKHVLRVHTGHVWGLAFSPDSSRLVTTSHDHTARIWEVASGRELFRLDGHTDKVQCAAWSADGRTIATGGFDLKLLLWNADGTLRQIYRPMGNVITSVTFSHDSRQLLVTLGGVASPVTDCWTLDVRTSWWSARFGGHRRSVLTGTLSLPTPSSPHLRTATGSSAYGALPTARRSDLPLWVKATLLGAPAGVPMASRWCGATQIKEKPSRPATRWSGPSASLTWRSVQRLPEVRESHGTRRVPSSFRPHPTLRASGSITAAPSCRSSVCRRSIPMTWCGASRSYPRIAPPLAAISSSISTTFRPAG